MRVDNSLESRLGPVFSLLPDHRAAEASRELLSQYAAIQSQSHELKWAEFDRDGRFRAGGATDASGFSRRGAAGPADDRQIAHLARRVRADDFHVGLLEPAPEADRLIWFLPYTPSSAIGPAVTVVRGLSIPFALFAQVLESFNPAADLKAGELRTIFQSLGGLSLRDAAARDGVAYETKRAHIKRCFEKLHCGSQRDMVRLVLGQMTHFLSLAGADRAYFEIAERYVSHFLAADMRLTVQRLANGHLLRVLEAGPPDGRPVVMLHGLMFPIPLRGIAGHLHRAGIRLLVPLRRGYLESRSFVGLGGGGDVIADSLADIALYLRQTGLAPATILGNSLGAVLAVELAARYPGLVSKLLLLSINLTRSAISAQNFAGEFYGGLRDINHEPKLFRLVNWQFRKYYADEGTCRTILLRLFGETTADKAVLEAKAEAVSGYALFSAMYQSSILGISEDFGFATGPRAIERQRLDCDVVVLHGQDDPLTEPSKVRRLNELGVTTSFCTVPGGGHFVAASHPDAIWPRIGVEAGGVHATPGQD